MKSFISLATVLVAPWLLAGTIILEWDDNTETDLAGYRVHHSTVGTNNTNFVQISEQGKVSRSTNMPVLGSNWYAVTAYNTNQLESLFSNLVYIYIPNQVQGVGLSYNRVTKLLALTWNANAAGESVTNYIVYEDGDTPVIYGRTLGTSIQITPQLGTHTFYVVAVSSTGGRSDPSSKVSYTGVNRPNNLRLIVN